jgi:NADH-quinone oxidoreductase subunit L
MFSLIFLPLFCGVFCGLFLRNTSKEYANFLTTFGVFVSFLVSCYAFYLTGIKTEVINVNLFKFVEFSGFSSNWAIYIDGLTAIMLVVVSFVSSLVHLYSIGYMHDDENQPKFMAFLSLFTFFMLILIAARDFMQLFVGWEGVGLCSYLLIGFWYNKESANKASIKAFITNRVGDLALILGMCGIYYLFKTLDFIEIKNNLNLLSSVYSIFGFEVSIATLIAVLLFIGCMGKSAQIMLHIWLPDAMEGPTPVSALIHAATMVTAGIFLVSRASFLFEYSEVARNIIIIIGTITAFFAASIALTQNDIKKIIAYSTCSQLGYMFVASGFSGYNAGIFHLATHAFFKALLFLSAGSVIHAMSGEQDIRKMGGLAKKIPLTFACMLIGSVAIAGIPPLSGFFSKDAILEVAFMSENIIGKFSFVVLVATACITTFYSWRLLILVFNGQTRNTSEVIDHIHESPRVMTTPLILLSIFAIIAGGFMELYLHILSTKTGILANSIYILEQNNVLENIRHTPMMIKFLPTVLSVITILFAYWYFKKERKNIIPKGVKNLVSNKYYFDELYSVIFVKPTQKISQFLINFFDKGVVDKLVVMTPQAFSNSIGKISARMQNGKIVQYFALTFVSIIGTFYFIITKF